MATSNDVDVYDSEYWRSTRGLLPSWDDDKTTLAYSSQHMLALQRRSESALPPTAADGRESAWDDTSSDYDPAPIILEISDARAPMPRARVRQANHRPPTASAAEHARRLRQQRAQPSAAVTQKRLRMPPLTASSTVRPAKRRHETLKYGIAPFAAAARPNASDSGQHGPHHTSAQARPMAATTTSRLPPALFALPARVEHHADNPFAKPNAWRGTITRSITAVVGLFGAVLCASALLDASAGDPR